jgi:2-polyprenyl-3-methyl-5-hydroxy-6-metoxy-1,4-benzoquinol methylase
MDAEKAELYLKEVDLRIRGLMDVVGHLHELKGYFSQLRDRQIQANTHEIQSLKSQISTMQEQLEQVGAPQIDLYERNLNFIHSKMVDQTWPAAADERALVRSKEAERYRAETIVDLLVPEYLKDLSFLDVGCGTGLTTRVAHERGAKIAVGYDVDQSLIWCPGETSNRLVFTHQTEDVGLHGPYDVVLMHDMLDHSTVEPVDLLKLLKEVLSERGRVYIRTHPWCSRHGAHLYGTINKAYLHLVLNDVELLKLGGYSYPYVRKILRPIDTYRKWFTAAGYRIVNETIRFENPEPFFLDNLVIRDRIFRHWDGQDPIPHMGVEYVDYLLEPNINSQIV